jgi:hypothetical protein
MDKCRSKFLQGLRCCGLWFGFNGAGKELRFLRHPCFEGGIDVGADGGPLALATLIQVEAIDSAVQRRVATVDALIAAVALLVGDADVEGNARDLRIDLDCIGSPQEPTLRM